MAGIPQSREAIQLLDVTSNRRTSRQDFWDGLWILLQAAYIPLHAQVGIQVQQAFEEAAILEAFQNTSYAFEQLGQRAMTRRFPRDLEDTWPFYGFPIENLSNQLGVTPELLTRRAMEIGFWDWPAHSDDEFVLIAAQLWIGEGLATQKAIFYVSREADFDEVVEMVRGNLQVGIFFGPESVMEIHFENNRSWFGPLYNTDEWEACIALPQNEFRVNLLAVITG